MRDPWQPLRQTGFEVKCYFAGEQLDGVDSLAPSD